MSLTLQQSKYIRIVGDNMNKISYFSGDNISDELSEVDRVSKSLFRVYQHYFIDKSKEVTINNDYDLMEKLSHNEFIDNIFRLITNLNIATFDLKLQRQDLN